MCLGGLGWVLLTCWLLVAPVTAATGITAGVLAVPPVPLLPAVPASTALPIGPQPQVPARPCSFAPLGATEMRTVLHHRINQHDTWNNGAGPVDTVDLSDPCHVFSAWDAVVTRTDDGGATMPIVLHPALPENELVSPVLQQPAVQQETSSLRYEGRAQLAPVITTAAGQEYTYDRSGLYGVIRSSDDGQHWEQVNAGLPLALGNTTIRTLTFAASDPDVGYTVIVASGVTSLFTTHDGGRSWQLVVGQAVQQATDITSVAIDPLDARHVVIGNGGSGAIWESADGGQSWSQRPLPPSTQGDPVVLFLTHPPAGHAGGTRLYLRTSSSGSSQLWRSFDDGTTWRYLVPAWSAWDGNAALAADPLNPDDMVAAQRIPSRGGDAAYGRIDLVASTDGFATALPDMPFDPYEVRGGVGQEFVFITQLGLAADRGHDFFLQFQVNAAPGTFGDVFAFHLPALSVPLHQTPPFVSAPFVPVPSGEPVLPAIGQCQVLSPGVDRYGDTQRNGPTAGSLTYDGQFLDYTTDLVNPGVIYRVDPVTCQPGPPLTPAVLPRDVYGRPWPLQQLTYDPRYVFAASGDQGAILTYSAFTNNGDYHQPPPGDLTPVYAVDPLTGFSEIALYLPPESLNNCCEAFTYDYFTDMLWVNNAYYIGPVKVPAVHGQPATPVDTCVDHRFPFGPMAGQLATVVVGGNGIMYGQLEDDQTLLRVDVRSCRLLDSFRTTKVNEADEDEQIACDPVSFGEGSAYAARGNRVTSVMWIRNSFPFVPQSTSSVGLTNNNTLSTQMLAYPIPDGVCPLPTALRLAPVPASVVGSGVPLCAVLRRETPGRPAIADAPVTFTIDGQPAASGRTDAAGGVCATAIAPGPAGVHTVRADYAGTTVLLASHDQGPMPTYGLGLGSVAQRLLPPLPPLGTSEPIPVTSQQPSVQNTVQSEAQAQLQTQAQTQSQVNAQTQTQAQPGMVVQRQRQTQVAVQMARGRTASPAYNASRLRGGRPAPPPVVVAAALLLGLTLLLRRPAVAMARARVRRTSM